MKKELKIWIFRHGRTFYNEKHIFTGWKDAKLSPKGLKDAEILAKKLKNKRIDLAFSSDLKRAKQTLNEVLKYHPKTKIILDKRLRERSYGKLEGKSHNQFIHKEGTEDYKTLLHWHKIDNLRGKEKQEFIKSIGEAELKIIRRSFFVKPPGGESIQMVEKRVQNFIKDLLKLMKKEKINVAISAHGNSIRPFRKYFEHLSIEKTMKIEQSYQDFNEYTIKI
jgi:2,3-bisphosphoglycerate-dependent phosphoglycerate mutase